MVRAFRDHAAVLAFVAAEADLPDIAGPLDKLTDVCHRFEKAWSGSWIGYQSRVYYSHFDPAPDSARFSLEWGLTATTDNPTQGNWVEYTHDEVVRAISNAAGNPELTSAEAYARQATDAFREAKEAMLARLVQDLAWREDRTVRRAIENFQLVEPQNPVGIIRAQMPRDAIASNDYEATREGVSVPPHIEYLSNLLAMRDPSLRCAWLSANATEIANYLERREAPKQRSSTGRPSIFIGHGGSQTWRVLKDFLNDRLELEWQELPQTPTEGVEVAAALRGALDSATVVLIIVAVEDEYDRGERHTRERLIHQLGLFQGRLGFQRVIVLLEDGCEALSTLGGRTQIDFPRGHIEECFEELQRIFERQKIIDAS
jgi:predicted nucleotide-binding protein